MRDIGQFKENYAIQKKPLEKKARTMKLPNVSGTFEEACNKLAKMSQDEWREFCEEVFKYNPSRPMQEEITKKEEL